VTARQRLVAAPLFLIPSQARHALLALLFELADEANLS
jgi:hypothetical protein